MAALVALGWIFGAAVLFMKVLVEDASTGEIVAGRLFFGSLVVGAFLLARGTPLDWRPWRLLQLLLLGSVELVAPYLLIAWAEISIDSGVAAVLIFAMPLFTALFAASILPDEPLTRTQLLGLGIGFAGVFIVAGVGTGAIANGDLTATLAVVGAAICYAAGTVYARVLLREGDALSLAGQQLILATAVSATYVLVTQGAPSYALAVEGWASLLALGILSTGIGTLGMFWLIGEVGSVQASLVTYIVPIAGLVLGWALLGETIGIHVILGLALIATGVTVVLRAGAPTRVEAMKPAPSTLPKEVLLSGEPI